MCPVKENDRRENAVLVQTTLNLICFRCVLSPSRTEEGGTEAKLGREEGVTEH